MICPTAPLPNDLLDADAPVIAPIALVADQATTMTAPSTVPDGEISDQQSSEDLRKAEMLLAKGDMEEARNLLSALDHHRFQDRTKNNQVQFLLGLIAMQDEEYDDAISRFRRVLVSEPGAVRVRLEMGRAYYLSGRYADAQRQFLYARAGTLPAAVRANIDRYLGAIRQRKSFSYGFSFAIVPDSNLNAGPATDTVSLYGLPFQLSPDAKANSGVGLSFDANAEWAPRIAPHAQWRIGGLLHRTQYRQTEFDDMTAAIYTGPHIAIKRWDINLQGNLARRWYGDRRYSKSYGPGADVTYYINPRFGVGLGLNLAQTDYDRNPLQNGLGETVGLSTFFTPTTSSYARGAMTVGHQDAAARAFAYHSLQLGLTYLREFRGGITASIAPTFTSLRYDAALAAFPAARRDRQYAVQLALLDRRLDFHGLTPRIAYTFIRNDSNLELYQFKRSRVEIGFTSSF